MMEAPANNENSQNGISDVAALAPSFNDPVGGAQATFRAILTAMSRPGSIEALNCLPKTALPISQATTAAALTLLDGDTPYWLPGDCACDDLRAYLAFHTGAPFVAEPQKAQFAIIPQEVSIQDLATMQMGTPEYPDRSTTVIIEAGEFGDGVEVELSGPGIETSTRFAATKLTEEFWQAAQKNHQRYPLGLDFVFTSNNSLAALPRSTAIRI